MPAGLFSLFCKKFLDQDEHVQLLGLLAQQSSVDPKPICRVSQAPPYLSDLSPLGFLWQQTLQIHNFKEYLEKFTRLLYLLELLGYSGCKEPLNNHLGYLMPKSA